MAEIVCVGTGEAFDPELPNNSVLYRGKLSLLIDCGYAVPHAFWRVTRVGSLLDAIYLTHIHADHSFGLPALLLWMLEQGRSRPLEIIGGTGIGGFVKTLFELGYPGAHDKCYPIVPVELAPGQTLDRNGVRLSNAESRHSVRNLALRLDEDGSSYCHSGDGRPSDATRELFRGASLLGHECYYDARDSRSHAHLDEILTLADELEVSTLALLHLGRNEKARIAARVSERIATRAGGRVVIPKPGDVLEVA